MSSWEPDTDGDTLSDAADGAVSARVTDLERMLDAAVEGLLVFDDAGRIRFASDSLVSALGDEVGSPLESLFPEHLTGGVRFDLGSAAAFRARCLGEEETPRLAVPFEAADGTALRATVSTVSLDAREGTACLVHELCPPQAGTPAPYRQQVHAAGDPMYAVNETGHITWVNEAAVEYTGYDRGGLCGRHASALLTDGEYERVTRRLLELVDSGRETATLEVTVSPRGGDPKPAEVRLLPLVDAPGAYAGSVGQLRDISDRKERERDLRLVKRMLTRVLRHNIRNELTIIQGRAELVRLDDGDTTEHADAIVESTERLFDHSEKARLIERVVETQRRVEVDLGRAVSKAVRSVIWAHEDATVETAVPADVTVEAHPELSRAIEELVENAIVHTPADRSPRVEVWLEERAGDCLLHIEDESGGFADAELEALLEGRETKLEHGSGVGLWLVYWLVEVSEAQLLADQTDVGTVMSLRFKR